MMVNGNLGAGVAVAGAFSLVRFRSVPGTAKEITMLFLAMGAGLLNGMGYLAYALLFTLILCTCNILYNRLDFGAGKNNARYKTLTITIPEDLEYNGVFEGILTEYASDCSLVRVKTTNMGSMFRLTYNLTLRDVSREKEMIDKLRCRNGNLEISLTATDDGLNAAGGTDNSGMGGRGGDKFGGPGMGGTGSSASITISGGSLYVNASGDGIDSNGTLTISGGYTVVCGPTQGDTSTLDYETSGVITGGTFIGTGASGMAQTFSSSEQGVIAVSVGSCAAGTAITLTDADGNTVISYSPELSFAVVILSSPGIVKGQPYTITVGSASGSFEAA